jgi:hypothetical protein
MSFTVEVSRDGNLVEQPSNMRVWLDHKYFSAADFRRSTGGGWQVDFESEREAREFAQAFFGRLLSTT